MDLITHAALSAAAAASLARPAQLRTAALAGAIAGLLPDADILIASDADPLLNLEFHRHFTHSIAFLPLGAAVAAAVAWLALRRRSPFRLLYGYAVAGYLAALLLDACTSYGTHLLWPLSAQPLALSVIAVIDPLFTVLVGVPLAFAVARHKPAAARLGTGLALAMIAFGALQHQRAASHAEQLAAARGHEPERLMVKPTLGNLVLWRSLYLHAGRVHVDAVRVGLPGSARIYPGESAPLYDAAADSALPAGSRARRDVERFVAFTGRLPVRHPRHPDMVGDARYAMLPTSIEPLWGIVVDTRAPDAPVRFRTLRESTPEVRKRFFDMLLGRDAALPSPSVHSQNHQPGTVTTIGN